MQADVVHPVGWRRRSLLWISSEVCNRGCWSIWSTIPQLKKETIEWFCSMITLTLTLLISKKVVIQQLDWEIQELDSEIIASILLQNWLGEFFTSKLLDFFRNKKAVRSLKGNCKQWRVNPRSVHVLTLRSCAYVRKKLLI